MAFLHSIRFAINIEGSINQIYLRKDIFMRAIEFLGDIKNGMVKIPKKFLSNLSNESVRIIILVKEQEPLNKKLSLKKRFKSINLDTRQQFPLILDKLRLKVTSKI